MNAIELIALSKAVADKDAATARQVIAAGKYLVDFSVTIKGALSVAEDYSSAPTCRAMSLETVATALYHAGCLRQRAIALIMQATTGDFDAQDCERKIYVDAIKTALQERFAKLPKEHRKGAVRAALVIGEEAVSFA